MFVVLVPLVTDVYKASTLEKFWKKYEATNKSITPAVESAGTSGADEGDDAGESKEDE
jgi:hypothetical protein